MLVPDGATVELGLGSLLVDRRHGPGVTVHAGDTTVDNLGQGAVRIEKSFSVLVVALSAKARVRTTTGPRLGLDELYQVRVAGRALPPNGKPVQLRHDDWERQVVPGLLADDDRLNDLYNGLRGPGAPVLPASYVAANAVRAGELVLADAIGRAAAKSEPARRSAGNRARQLRGEGGSWGVVAHLLDASVVDVGSALAEVLNGIPADAPDSPSPTRTPGGAVAGKSPDPGVTPSPTPTGGRTKDPGPTDAPTDEPTEPSETPDTIESIISGLPSPLVPPLFP